MKVTSLIIDPKSLGSTLWLVDVTPVHEYRDNKKTDVVIGFKYVVCMPDKNFEKIGIKIDGKKLMETPDGYVDVTFSGLELFLFWLNGQPQVGGRATSISLVNSEN